jgi:hypothetical protein
VMRDESARHEASVGVGERVRNSPTVSVTTHALSPASRSPAVRENPCSPTAHSIC